MSKTIALARKYGFVEEILLKSGDFKTCAFSHLIVIDFESTCWNDGRKGGRNEIIEFPAVLLDMQTGIIVNEFRHFVSPSENPKLSDFCVNLTGISQEQVDGGIPLTTCICLFTKWVKEVSTNFNVKSMALVTWSDWDLNVCLDNECKRKNISKPDIFNKWIDLRALFKEHTQKPPRGLLAAVESVGLKFIGREHSGIDDARNTAHLAWKLFNDGMALRITKNCNS